MLIPSRRTEENPPVRGLEPKDVLFYYDEPLLFSSSLNSRLVLCYKIDEIDEYSQYLLVPTNMNTIDRLKSGAISVRTALLQSWCWIADVDDSLKIIRWWEENIDSIPEQYLPETGYALYYEHEIRDKSTTTKASGDAFLALHFKGGELGNETIGFRTFKTLLDDTYASVWQIFTPALYKFFDTDRRLRSVVNIPVRQPL